MSRIVNLLNEGLHRVMERDRTVFLLGEDILDPYGGAFKAAKGLSTRFPDRVLTTPISEAGITGVAGGLALRGYKPVVEIMFGDFVTLIADQLINQITKMACMYRHPIPLNLVVRTPMGGRRGYGPTHSQTLERLFFGTPGLRVVAISHLLDPGRLLEEALTAVAVPVLFIENKLLYSEFLLGPDRLMADWGLTLRADAGPFPTLTLSPAARPDVTLVTYGGMVPLALQAAAALKSEEGLDCELVVAHQLSPLLPEPIRTSALRSRRLVTIEEGPRDWGWGAEVAAQLADVSFEAPVERVGAAPSPIPAARTLEARVLPQVADIVAAALRTVDRVHQ